MAATAPPLLVKCPDYRTTSGLTTHRRSYRVRKYFRKRMVDWMNINTTVSASQDMKTFVAGDVPGIAPGRSLGRATLCFYVRFRGQIL